jgi:hypothetical protein
VEPSLSDFLINLVQLAPSMRQYFWLLFVAQSWALWHIRNKLTIDKKLPKQPTDYFLKSASFVQLWLPLMKPKHIDNLDMMVGGLRALYLQTRKATSQGPPPVV